MVVPITVPTIQKHLDSDRRFRERRHQQFTVNYTLYRDTVIVNRLTQRQSVNVPYMKKTIKTYLTQTNWPVDNYYENQANDKQAELFPMEASKSGMKEGSLILLASLVINLSKMLVGQSI